MGTQSGFDPNAFGPFGALFQTYFSVFESFSRGAAPANGSFSQAFDPQAVMSQVTGPLKSGARCQLEVMGLANRRVQAYVQAPSRLAQCRTPQDVVNEQLAFWRTAAEQYTDSSRKIGEVWAQAFPWLNPAAMMSGGSRTERDYINFNGTGREPGASASPETVGKQRRVA